MNRRERRLAQKKEKQAITTPAGVPLSPMPVVGAADKPTLLLRLVSKVLLARWVLARVHHPRVRVLLAEVARQVGRMDAVVQLRGGQQTQGHDAR